MNDRLSFCPNCGTETEPDADVHDWCEACTLAALLAADRAGSSDRSGVTTIDDCESDRGWTRPPILVDQLTD
jgi:hypothetical protein